MDIKRAEAVNLARNLIEFGPVVSNKGAKLLAEAILEMDMQLLKLSNSDGYAEQRVYIEHGFVCIRTETGQLLASKKLDEFKDNEFITTAPTPDGDRLDAERLKFLHSNNKDADGYEYGVAKVRFANGQLSTFEWALSDHSDIDQAIANKEDK